MTKKSVILKENSRSTAGRQLPPVLDNCRKETDSGSILLFYQYKEPEWSDKEHKNALKTIIALGEKLKIKGRGRVAPEGLNCTLSGNPQSIRDFCIGLRALDAIFNETDFKITDGISRSKLFKSLSIRKAKELVAYGLAGEKAPSLRKFAGEHLEADAYHHAMKDKDTVIIDVRNNYESSIGSFQPPKGGAELIDPQMRNSIEFPKWLNDPATQKKLNGKKVLMYCTGGIRCERATALLNQMSAVKPDELKPKAVYELRGGIERYMKTFPQGGFWKGKNYLFDRRMEQIPDSKSATEVEQETKSVCCVCQKPWAVYRGKFKCSQSLCGVPVIVCDDCSRSTARFDSLICGLCKIGYRAPQLMPDLVALKRKAEESAASSKDKVSKRTKETVHVIENDEILVCHNDRLFLARLPLTVTRSKLSTALGIKIKNVHWLQDKISNAFYGSCLVQLESTEAAQQVMGMSTIKVDKKKIKISFAKKMEGDSSDVQGKEYPPMGN